jgi:pyruvate, water dikinase
MNQGKRQVPHELCPRGIGWPKLPHVRWFDSISLKDLAEVSGKTASIGELSALLAADRGRVPDGFALTAHAYR